MRSWCLRIARATKVRDVGSPRLVAPRLHREAFTGMNDKKGAPMKRIFIALVSVAGFAAVGPVAAFARSSSLEADVAPSSLKAKPKATAVQAAVPDPPTVQS